MTAEIHLPKSAYAPGENIVGTFTVDSRTAKNALEHVCFVFFIEAKNNKRREKRRGEN
jgi:hypothetical protein